MIKVLAGIVVLIGLGLGTYYWQASGTVETSAQKTPEMARVERGPLKVTTESTGTVEPDREVEIKCEASGEITTLPVDVSDVVKKCDLLVQLDPSDEKLEFKRAQVAAVVTKAKLNQAKLTLEIARQDLENSRLLSTATLASAQAAAREAAAQLERSEKLYDKKISSKQTLQTSETANAQAIANLRTAEISVKELDTRALKIKSLQQAISIAEQDVFASEIDLDEAKERLGETTVLSPMNGVVTACDVQEGQIISSGTSSVNGGTTVLYLADMSRMYVLVSVDESDIGTIRKGQTAQVTVDAFPMKAFDGMVVRVASKGMANSNVVTFEVKVEVTSTNKTLLKPGMTANVGILIVDKKDILRVPSEAVHQTSKACTVTVVKADGTTDIKNIKIGESDGDWTEILSGLKEGDSILLTQGQKSTWRSDENRSQQTLSSSLLGGSNQRGGGQGGGGQGGPRQ